MDRVYRKLQVHRAVAAELVLQEQRVVHRAHCQTVELEAVHCVGSVLAYSVHEQSVVDRVHCQLQVDQAVAAILVLQEQRVVHRAHCQAVELEAVKCIYVVLADSVHEQCIVDRVHCECQVHYAVAAVDVGQVEGVVGGSHRQAVEVEAVQCIVHTIADRIHEQSVVYRVHCQME